RGQPLPRHRPLRLLRRRQRQADRDLRRTHRLPAPQAGRPGHPRRRRQERDPLRAGRAARRHVRTARRRARAGARPGGRAEAGRGPVRHRRAGHVPLRTGQAAPDRRPHPQVPPLLRRLTTDRETRAMNRREPLGIAVIGTGRMGADHVRRIDRTIGGARVPAVADVDAERAAAVAGGSEGCPAHTDPAAAMAAPGVDAVLIASPGPAHEAALLAAFEHDLPVLCEKPLTPDAASALRVMEAEQALGHRRVQVGFMRRYDAEYVRLKSLLDTGQLGRPLMLHNRHRNVASPPYFTSSLLISDSVAHEVDATRWLLGHEITAVTVLRPAASAGAPEGL